MRASPAARPRPSANAGPITIWRFFTGSSQNWMIVSGGRQVKTSTRKSTAVRPIQKLGIARKSVMKRRTMLSSQELRCVALRMPRARRSARRARPRARRSRARSSRAARTTARIGSVFQNEWPRSPRKTSAIQLQVLLRQRLDPARGWRAPPANSSARERVLPLIPRWRSAPSDRRAAPASRRRSAR